MMPNLGGGSIYQYLLAKELYNEGIEVIFPNELSKGAFLFPISRNVFQLKTKLIHMHWVEGYSGFSSKNKLSSRLKLLIFIIDIYSVKYLLKAKIVWTIHNLYSHECNYRKIEKLGRKIFSKKVDAIICHCKYAKKEFIKEFGALENKIHLIKHGNFNCYENQISKEKAREDLNFESKDFIYLIFGSIRPYKGTINLIESFKKLRKNRNVKLLIVGKPINNQIKRDILNRIKNSPNIKFIFKFITEDQIQVYFKASDIIVYPFKKILTSGGIFLAMSFGKPIIAPRLGCIPETIDEKGAFLYNPKKMDGLLNALEKAIENRDKLKKMGEYNIKLANKFEWKTIAIETKKIYDRFSR